MLIWIIVGETTEYGTEILGARKRKPTEKQIKQVVREHVEKAFSQNDDVPQDVIDRETELYKATAVPTILAEPW